MTKATYEQAWMIALDLRKAIDKAIQSVRRATRESGEKATMDDMYGDGSDHEVCPICELCVTCGDCASEYGCGEDEESKAKNAH